MTPLRQQFADQLKIKGRSDNTISKYVSAVVAISQHFNTSPLLLKKEQIESYQFFQLQEKKLSVATVNLCTDALKAFFKIMDPQNTVMSTFSKIKGPRHLPVVLSREEVESLIATVGNLKQKAALMLLYSAGLRLHECVRLKPNHSAVSPKRWVIFMA